MKQYKLNLKLGSGLNTNDSIIELTEEPAEGPVNTSLKKLHKIDKRFFSTD